MANKKAKKTNGAAPAPAAAKVKILTPKFNKAEECFEAYDASGKLYTEEDCPRQIMLQLALKANQELYFGGKKWRRRKPVAAVAVTAKVIKTEKKTAEVAAK